MKLTENLIFVEMATQLQADESGTFRKKLLDQLAHYKQSMQELAPLAPDRAHFNIIEQLKRAIQYAETILTQ